MSQPRGKLVNIIHLPVDYSFYSLYSKFSVKQLTDSLRSSGVAREWVDQEIDYKQTLGQLLHRLGIVDESRKGVWLGSDISVSLSELLTRGNSGVVLDKRDNTLCLLGYFVDSVVPHTKLDERAILGPSANTSPSTVTPMITEVRDQSQRGRPGEGDSEEEVQKGQPVRFVHDTR